MPDQSLTCPYCGKEIEVTEVLAHSIRQSIEADMQAGMQKKEAELARRQAAFDEKVKALERQKAAMDEQVAEKVKAQRQEIAREEKAKLLAQQAVHDKALQEELAEKDQAIKAFRQQELELRKQQRQLLEAKEAFELEATRKLDEERKKIMEEAGKKATEEQMLKLKEKDQLIESWQKQAQEWQRRAQIGSQEAQGEALECQLQEELERAFPYDQFSEIKKGARGADILQRVRNLSGRECGSILWESKNTRDFQKPWIEKLKADQQDANADIAVIMSIALPKGVDRFGLFEDVWVTDYKSAVCVCLLLRDSLIRIQRERAVNAGRESIKDVIYNYITSNEFAMHVRAMVNSYETMRADMESEKRAMQRIWSKREKQIATVLDNVTRMYGSIEGLVGQKTLPAIDMLSLDAAGEEEQ